MYQLVLRVAFFFLLAAVTYLALTPGPLGTIVEQGEHRHILAFAAMPIASSIAWPRLGARLQFFAYAALGGAIEIVQGAMDIGRVAQFDDWLIDIAAAAAALACVSVARGIGRAEPLPG